MRYFTQFTWHIYFIIVHLKRKEIHMKKTKLINKLAKDFFQNMSEKEQEKFIIKKIKCSKEFKSFIKSQLEQNEPMLFDVGARGDWIGAEREKKLYLRMCPQLFEAEVSWVEVEEWCAEHYKNRA